MDTTEGATVSTVNMDHVEVSLLVRCPDFRGLNVPTVIHGHCPFKTTPVVLTGILHVILVCYNDTSKE